MDEPLTQAILAAGNVDGEDTIWMQMLVFVLLVVLLAIGHLIKTKANSFKNQRQDRPEDSLAKGTRRRQRTGALKELKDKYLGILRTAQLKTTIEKPVLDFNAPDIARRDKPRNKSAGERPRDLHSGMEILELDLLLSIVEKTEGDDEKNVVMRELNFKELRRREQLAAVDSDALKVYAVNKRNLYGRAIQCEAMKELTIRTARKSKHGGPARRPGAALIVRKF
jgi:hypothetical protein